MHRFAVSFGINRHRINTHFLTGAMNTQGNLAAIGDQDFLKRGRAGHDLYDNKQGFAEFDGLRVLN